MSESDALMHDQWLRLFQQWRLELMKPITISAEQVIGQPLTRVNDTNVTATLTGTPATALLKAVTITLGWSGTLAAARLNANVVQAVTNDTNVTGVIAAQTLTLGWTGQIPVTRGGNGLATLVTGDLWYGSAADTASRRAIGSPGDVLTVSAGLPVWSAPAAAATVTITNDTTTNASMFPTWVTANTGNLPLKVTSTKLSFNPSTGVLSLATALPPASGGTGLASYAIGDLLYASGATTLAKLADVAAGSYLRSGGVTTAPLWSTLTLPNSAATGDLLYASGANAMALRTIGSTADVLTVTGGVPVWAAPAASGSSTITDDTTTNAAMFPVWVTAASGSLPLKVSSTKLAFRPSTGNLGLGTSSPTQPLHVVRSGGSDANVRLDTYSSGPTSAYAGRTSQGTLASPSVSVVDDNMVWLQGQGMNGNLAFAIASELRQVVDASPTATIVRGRFSFFTHNGTTFAERMRLSSAGLLSVGPLASFTPSAQLDVAALDASVTTSVIRVNHIASVTPSTGQATGFLFAGSTDSVDNQDMARILAVWTTIADATRAAGFQFQTVTGGGSLTTRVTIDAIGNTGFGTTSPTAVAHLKAGTATASTAPLKFTSGTNLTTAEAGAMEYNGTNLFFTRAGTVREIVSVVVTGATAPATSIGVGIVNYYGTSATNFLGDPVAWESVNYAGTVYKRPLYT